MPKSYVSSLIYPPLANYSHAVAGAGRNLFLSGQLGIAPDGTLPLGAYEQAKQCFANIDAILQEAQLDVCHIMRINAFVTDREYLPAYMKARDEWIENLDEPPASTLMIVVGFAQPEMKVEVEVTACFEDCS